ncbi:MAG TPA: response regulator transcription factor [Nitrospirae bacterium]|nr:transcriptional regulatory protein DegU [bacterium BMS3Abin06]HDH11792.1 response regulator transcription factor [Nitrospirota bacterium]HDZ02866.1 response regulator transcription factor [Nitrospirota bacterium]
MKTKILLVDDHKILRDGLCSLAKGYPDMDVVGEAADGRTAIRLVQELSPDVVIMDISMPDLNGIDATRRINSDYPDVKIIALSMHYEKQFVSEIFKAGASGYLIKDSAFDELEHAIRVVMDGKTYMNPQIANLVIESLVSQSAPSSRQPFSLLTERESEVLQLISEGKSTKQIATDLNVSAKTIESHRRQVMGKLNIRNVAQLTKYAIREGLTSV